MSGKPVTSKPVYGYVMDEDENFIIDEEAAPVVAADYQLCLAGERPDQDCPYADGAANPHAGDAGISADRQHPPLSPGYECKWATTPSFISSKTESTPDVW